MEATYYVPIYKWSDVSPDSIHESAHGSHFYHDLNDLYGFEPDAVGHFELKGKIPTENEFKAEFNLKSGAV